MINYIIQVLFFQILFLVVYDLFLSKETFFQKNRFYLLATPLLSFFLPLIKIPTFQKAVSTNETMIFLPEIIISPQKVIEQAAWFKSINYLELVFWIGVVIFAIIFIIKLIKIFSMIHQNEKEKRSFFQLIFLPKKAKAFSFFNFIFIGKEFEKNQQEKIIEHEIVHSKQKHSADLLFFEFLKIVMWFNPLLYFYQQRIAVIHEYIADDFATKIHQKEQYINSLLSEVFAVENISFINQFYKQSFIKKRIIMMKKEKSKHAKQLKYLLLIPVLVSMLFYTSCSENRMETIDNNVEESIMINQNGKEFQFVYLDMGKGVIKSISNKKTYLDLYVGQEKLEGEEVTYDDLNKLERDEFDTMYSRLKKMEAKGVKFYLNERKRKTVAVDFDFSKIRNRNYEERNGINNFTITEEITEEIPFSIIEKTPTFPGCESGDKNCFHKMIQNHFTKNFDSGLPKTLSLTTGMKKIYVGFKIDEKGNVIDIQARTPHEKITEEVIRVMELLPKMMPGEQRGTKITVKYSIPFTITVE